MLTVGIEQWCGEYSRNSCRATPSNNSSHHPLSHARTGRAEFVTVLLQIRNVDSSYGNVIFKATGAAESKGYKVVFEIFEAQSETVDSRTLLLRVLSQIKKKSIWKLCRASCYGSNMFIYWSTQVLWPKSFPAPSPRPWRTIQLLLCGQLTMHSKMHRYFALYTC